MPSAGTSEDARRHAVSIMQREMSLLCERVLLRARIADAGTVMLPTRAVRGAHQSSLRQEQELLHHHADEELQHGAGMATWLDGSDVHTSESTFTATAPQRLRVSGRATRRWNARNEPDTLASSARCARAIL